MNLKRLTKLLSLERKHLLYSLERSIRFDPILLASAARKAAREFREQGEDLLRAPKVITRISEGDRMYKKKAALTYFRTGYSSLGCIDAALAKFGNPVVKSILDLPCGHGRVLRALRARFPAASIVASDLEMDGVDFCAKTFKATRLYSKEDVRELSVDARFDLIWVGSLFTHLDAPLWKDFLEFFSKVLTPGGLLIFTTHGPGVIRGLLEERYRFPLSPAELEHFCAEYDRASFAYQNYKSANRYGLSASSPEWAKEQVQSTPELNFLACEEQAWVDFQDVVVCSSVSR